MIGQDGYTKEYFQGRGPEQKDFHMFVQWIETIALKPKSRIYDVGCGTGKFVHIAIENGFDAIGYDPHINPENLYGRAVVTTSGPTLAKNEFGLVLNIDTLEHLNNETEVDEMLKHIEETGKEWFIFSICDLEHWHIYQDATHKFCRSRKWWENKLSQYFELLPTPTDWLYHKQFYLARKKSVL